MTLSQPFIDMPNKQLLYPLCLISIFFLKLPFDSCQLKLIKVLAWRCISNLIKIWRLFWRKPIGQEENDLVMGVFQKIMRLNTSFFNVKNRSYLLIRFETVIIKSCLEVCIVLSERQIIGFASYCETRELIFREDRTRFEVRLRKSYIRKFYLAMVLECLNQIANINALSSDSTLKVCLSLPIDLPPQSITIRTASNHSINPSDSLCNLILFGSLQ